jgi:predicted acyltransferase
MAQSNVSLKRADALDALRGLAILAMVFSGTLRYKILPAWMYHAQEPPPTHAFNKAIAGLTWVDVVFPLFLFAMGAAIPLALTRRLDKGWKISQIIGYIFKRGLLLGAFAIILQQLRPFTINSNPIANTWLLAMAGFLLLTLMFGRLPTAWKLGKYGGAALMAIGWIGTLLLISQLSYGGKGFQLERSDPILIALANMAIFGALAWWATRSAPFVRVGLLGILLALQFSASTDGWIKVLWESSPIPWLFQFYYLKYLFIVIPGTIAGDLILQWTQSPEDLEEFQPRSQQRLWLIVLSMLMLCLVLLVGLQSRAILLTTVVSGAIAAVSWFLFKPLLGSTGKLLQQLYQWGLYWLALGLCFEPYQGGIHKDPSTYSYYFVTAAIALFLLISLTVLISLFHWKPWLLIDNGRNPMVAYVAFANLLWPILQLTGLEDLILTVTNTPIMGVLKGIIYTIPIALLTCYFTHIKLFWRT